MTSVHRVSGETEGAMEGNGDGFREIEGDSEG
jgi:hypothetical protein